MDAAEVLEDVARGDLSAFELLYDEYVELVFAIALRIVRDEALAEDITHNVFVKILTAPHAFRPGNFAGWIGRVARNCAVDEVRRASRSAPLFDYAVDEPSDDVLDEVAIAHLDAARAREVMATLSPEQRSSIELAFFGGLSHQEIAVKTGTPLGTVKTRIRAGLAAMRTALHVSIP